MISSLSQYQDEYKESVENPEKFWKKYSQKFLWKKNPSQILEWNFDEPKVKWFSDGKLNITENIFERNFNLKSNTAIIWEPNDINEKSISFTYNQLFKRVCSFANVLKKLGVAKGDRV
ncbi:MAG: acetyl-coenzyme A synthetase N-terminal domain-containing protein, partial [Marinoscillum sp.]